ncbi:MAG: hypothetical protein AYK19_22185 [Theionarchaea archaeon DG-70-1]|nr:MAG: hypothetical protein AYK19_22185 [Theionarchaea archaeon DG-70-1]
MLSSQKESEFLYKGIPCIRFGDKWAILSPYSRRVAVIDDSITKEVAQRLDIFEFFGTPSSLGPSNPDHFDITILNTSACNLYCRYCFVSGGTASDYMSNEIAERGIRQCIELTPRHIGTVSFFGGEPTMNVPLIKFAVDFVRSHETEWKKQFSFSITTNGVMPASTLDYLIDAGFCFTVSSDGLPEIQNHQRPGKNNAPSAEYVAHTIKVLAENKIPFKVRCTVCDRYVDKMAENVEYFHSLGARIVHFEPVTYAGRGYCLDDTSLKKPPAERFVKEFEKALVIAEDLDIKLMNAAFMNFLIPSMIFCDSHTNSRFVLTYDGQLSRCLEIQDASHELASYGILSGIDDMDEDKILNNKKLFNFRSEAERGCGSCFGKYTCGGGCPVRNIRATGYPNIVGKYECYITRRLLRSVLSRIVESTVRNSTVIDTYKGTTIYDMDIPFFLWMKNLEGYNPRQILSVKIG